MTTIDARQRILQDNEAAAARLRARFERTGTLAINLISSPGSGKTALLEATARRLAGRVRMAAVVGDVATELDAERLRAAGLRAEQIVTQGACHLDARMVDGALAGAGFGEDRPVCTAPSGSPTDRPCRCSACRSSGRCFWITFATGWFWSVASSLPYATRRAASVRVTTQSARIGCVRPVGPDSSAAKHGRRRGRRGRAAWKLRTQPRRPLSIDRL
jgi:hypothetical protein